MDQTCREVDRNFQIHPFPVIFQQYTKFLCDDNNTKFNINLEIKLYSIKIFNMKASMTSQQYNSYQ